MTGAEAGLIAGIVGGGSAVFAAGIATLGTYKVTSRSTNAERRRATEARLADVYTDLIWLTHAVMARVEATRPKVKFLDDSEIPVVSVNDEARIKARVQAIGSHNGGKLGRLATG